MSRLVRKIVDRERNVLLAVQDFFSDHPGFTIYLVGVAAVWSVVLGTR